MNGPLGRDRLAGLLEPALRADADGILAIAIHTWGGLTRFAGSQIHQNTARSDLEILILAVVDGTRSAVTSTRRLDPGAVARAAGDAAGLARLVPPDPEFPGLATPASIPAKDAYDPAAAAAGPGERAEAVAAALAEVPAGMEAAGFIETGGRELALASTSALDAYACTSAASGSVMAMTDTSSGFAESADPRLAALDPRALAARAARKAEMGRDPVEVPPGRYRVVLEPAATATLIQFLGYCGFGAKAFLEGRSFLSGRIGERLAAETVTIRDDPLASDAFGLPFDFEGTPAQPVTLIERGVARGVVWDRATAKRAGRSSTGHALRPPGTDGPLPLNLRMEPGATPLGDMVAATERGLLITRFHYTNVLEEKATLLTGLTRDGTFLIEDGKLQRGVRNLRYTESAIDALARVDAVGDRTEMASELFFGGARAPAVAIDAFRFTAATDH